jgi:hypothetical protein
VETPTGTRSPAATPITGIEHDGVDENGGSVKFSV